MMGEGAVGDTQVLRAAAPVTVQARGLAARQRAPAVESVACGRGSVGGCSLSGSCGLRLFWWRRWYMCGLQYGGYRGWIPAVAAVRQGAQQPCQPGFQGGRSRVMEAINDCQNSSALSVESSGSAAGADRGQCCGGGSSPKGARRLSNRASRSAPGTGQDSWRLSNDGGLAWQGPAAGRPGTCSLALLPGVPPPPGLCPTAFLRWTMAWLCRCERRLNLLLQPSCGQL